MRQFIHLFTVYTPTMIYYSVMLLLLAVKQYAGIALRVLGGVKDSAVNIIFFFVWMFIGLPFQVKLYFQDVSLISSMMLDFRDAEDTDLYKIYIDQSQRLKLSAVYHKIYHLALRLKRSGTEVNMSV